MDFSLKRSSFSKSSHGSSSSKQFHHNHSRNFSSSDFQNPEDDDDDDETHHEEHHPILSHHRRHTHDSTSSAPEISSFPMSPPSGDVIIKIDAPNTMDFDDNDPHDRSKSKGIYKGRSSSSSDISFWKDDKENPSSGHEFSFRRPDDDIIEESHKEGQPPSILTKNDFEDSTSKLIGNFLEQQQVKGEMSLEMDLEMEEIRQGQDPQPRQGQGLPPLPRDSISRQSWSRNPSEVQSPDSSTYNNYKNIQTVNNNNNNNYDGFREIRVSFQDSFNSELVKRRSSIYSTVEGDSSTSSSMTGEEENQEYERSRGAGGGGPRSKRTSSSSTKDPSASDSGEIIRCTSNNASIRRLTSISASKTKSRLMDPPSTPLDQRSGNIPKSGPLNMKSGFLGKSMIDEEEDDPFFDDDFPDEFRRGKIGTLIVLEWVSLVIMVGAFICSLIIPVLKMKTLWKMKLWKWEVLVLVLICGRLVSDWGIRILVFFIERNFLLRKRVLYFVYGLKKAVQNVLWIGLGLVTWHFLFDKKVEREARSEPLKVVTKLLVIGEVCAILWLLKTLLVKVCASTFHVNAFFDRIQESLFNQFVIETLSGPPLFDFQNSREEEERTFAEVQMLQNAGITVPPDLKATVFPRTKSGRLVQPNNSGKMAGMSGTPYKSPIGQSTRLSGPISKKNEEGITIEHLHRLNQKNISAWNMKRLMRIVRHGSLTTLDEHIVDTTTHEDESATQIRSEIEAKAAARKIFRNVARPRTKYIYFDDLLRFMREDEAMKTLSLFEGETERISKSALKNWVVNAFRERRALSLTLSDTKTAVNKLHKIVNVVVISIMTLIICTQLNIITSQSVVFLSSQVVVAAFVFGNTCRNIFESIIFLFVIHPFDVGDRCEIDGVQMVVEEMNILTTVFLRYDNLKIVFPNYVLLTKPINNFYRSPDMGDAVEFYVHIATPVEKITIMRQRITNYIDNKKEHWHPEPMIILKDVENFHMLKIAVWLCHRMNHQDMGEKFARRALLVEECVRIFRDLDIEYRIYPLNVNIHSIPPLHYFQAPSPNRTTSTTEGNKEIIQT